jgi:hypothetical protein
LLVPLSQARHGTRRWRRLTEYGFARTRRAVPIALAEAEIVATAMPLVFVRDDGGALMPVALLRLNATQSPFIGAQGQWQAPYIPARLRVHPFDARAQQDAPADTRMVLLVDESTDHVTDDPMHERFFDPFGAPAPALAQVVDFFKHYQANLRETRQVMVRLEQLRTPAGDGLFEPIQTPDGQPVADIWGISRERFDSLPDDQVGTLRTGGALGLIMAHFISRHQINWLTRAEQALAHLDGGYAQRPAAPPAAPDISDFLSALANSQDRDNVAQNGAPTPPFTG